MISEETFPNLVLTELRRAREANHPMRSVHEGYAVILEELDELWEEVKLKRSQRSPQHMLEELVQISAMAQRMAEDVVMPLLPTVS